VGLDINSELTGHFSNVEREVFNVIGRKTDQALKDGFDPTTLLVVDASRLGLSWLRPETVWGSNLAHISLDWPNLPFVGLLVCFTALNTLHVGGALVLRPDITETQSLAVDAVARAFGFSKTNWQSDPGRP
jgi:hypothetical protein